MDVDEGSTGTAGLLVVDETNEQFFDRPEVRELVDIPDTPDIPEASPTMETEAEEPEEWNPSPISPAPSSPLSPPPPSPLPLYLEPSGVPVYPVERIVQAWGPRDGRQYLIRWQGWGEEYDSWELAANVSEDLVADFERSRLRRMLSQRRQRKQRRRWGC